MRTLILKLVGILVVAFALGTAVGVLSPTEVEAGPNCLLLQQCFEYTGGCGTGGCGSCQRPYRITNKTDFSSCCGTVLQSGCWSCAGCPPPCLDC